MACYQEQVVSGRPLCFELKRRRQDRACRGDSQVRHGRWKLEDQVAHQVPRTLPIAHHGPGREAERRAKDTTLTYVSLEEASGMTIGCDSQAIHVLHIHRRGKETHFDYAPVVMDYKLERGPVELTWCHCPIQEGELVQRVWLVEDKGTYSLLIRTTRKTAWLGAPGRFTDQRVIDEYYSRHYSVSSAAPLHGIYYYFPNNSSTHRVDPPIVGPLPTLHVATPPPSPSVANSWRRDPAVPTVMGDITIELSFSRASMDNVRAVRKSERGAVELQYDGYSMCLGDFRPHEALDWMDNPRWYQITEDEMGSYCITFFQDKEEESQNLKPMEGEMRVWYRTIMGEVLVMLFGAMEPPGNDDAWILYFIQRTQLSSVEKGPDGDGYMG
ncbi:hypothetical protein M011DRAFT_498610 [Sporormia fimetaria CBS 119925]|uniref:Uncharacterized protein n=1 Tax=Sporormia fimetaria CBS 119925 TaxID=1340428 RepID=A0A6A6VPL2_9PLEO|nr:hypothetical protein M011DRAFT_498610 [Sporormia fimetaria CBS 119925]